MKHLFVLVLFVGLFTGCAGGNYLNIQPPKEKTEEELALEYAQYLKKKFSKQCEIIGLKPGTENQKICMLILDLKKY